jgi:hypothetical protein
MMELSPTQTANDWHGLAVYGIRLSWQHGPRWPDYPGNTLRGLLGQALFDNVCVFGASAPACKACPLNARCAYPAVFKPVEEGCLPPYWLHGWQMQGPDQSCVLNLLPQALPFLEAWLDGLDRYLAKTYRTRLAAVADTASQTPLWQASQWRQQTPSPVPFPRLEQAAVAWHSLTPLVSKHQGDPLHGALRTRLQRLINRYGDGAALPLETAPWQAQIIARRPFDLRLARRGLSGAYLHLQLRDITPAGRALLNAGMLLHGGGETSLGCGRYRLDSVAA